MKKILFSIFLITGIFLSRAVQHAPRLIVGADKIGLLQAVHTPGSGDVAVARQGVASLVTNEQVKQASGEKGIMLVSSDDVVMALPRSTPDAEQVNPKGISDYFEAVKESGQELHSLMVLRHGKVVVEKWFDGHGPAIPHVMHSVSKTWTSTAVGFAVQE